MIAETEKESKIYSLKQALDALEKGFTILDCNGTKIECLDIMFHFLKRELYSLQFSCDITHVNEFKILPKKEKANFYPVLIKCYHPRIGWVDSSSKKWPKFNDKENALKWFYSCKEFLSGEIFCGLITGIPELIDIKEIEIHYEEMLKNMEAQEQDKKLERILKTLKYREKDIRPTKENLEKCPELYSEYFRGMREGIVFTITLIENYDDFVYEPQF